MTGNDLNDVLAVSASALAAQNQRMKVIAQNIANANNTASAPGSTPYQRQVITFQNEFDRAIGAYKVKVAGVQTEQTQFIREYDPANPAADNKGYVLKSNVNPLIEMMDMSDAGHAYQANLNAIDAARGMALRTINLLQ